MARIRTIKPEFFTDGDIGALPPLARLFFIGLWCHADKAGRLKDKPLDLKVRILPFDEIDARGMLAELEHGKFITRYTVDGCGYIQIRTWEEHQWLHKCNERESCLPSREGDNGCTTVTQPLDNRKEGKGREGKERKGRGGKGKTSPPLLDLSMLLQTETLRRAWIRWIEYRTEAGRPLTPQWARSQQKKLAQWGQARAIRAIEHTIENGLIKLQEPDEPADDSLIDVGKETAARRKEVATQAATAKADPLKPIGEEIRKAMRN